jgi:hypothetical protein
MFKDLTYRQKNKYLLIGFGVFLLLSYMLAIKDTLSAFFDYKALQKKEVQMNQAPQELRSLQVKLKGMNYLIENKQKTHGGVHASLLNAISAYCDEYEILLREYPGSRENIQNDLVVETNIFEVQGPFIKLINLVYLLEQKQHIGKVASVKFQSKRDLQTRDNILTVTVYIQNVKKNTHEDIKDI